MANSTSRRMARLALDARLGQLQPTAQWTRPSAGWIKAIRTALGMTSAGLGRRLDITAAGLRALEASEAAETIKLSSLRRVADVLDCDLVVVMVPRNGLEATMQNRAEQILATVEECAAQSMRLEGQVVMEPEAWRQVRRDELISGVGLWRDD